MKPLVCLFILFVAIAISIDNNVIFDLSNGSYAATYNGKTYYFNALIEANWHEAYQLCRQNGFQLVSTQSQEENEWSNKFIIKHGWLTKKKSIKYHFWTSGTDLGGSKYVWMSTGQPLTYTNWFPDEPNNAGGNEHCLEIRTFDNKTISWNDAPCNIKRYCICEKRVNC